MGAQRGDSIPGGHRTHGAQYQPDDAASQRVLQGTVGSQPRCDIAAQDGVDDAIGGGQDKECVTHRLTQGRERADRMQQAVRANGKNDDNDESCQEREGAAPPARTRANCTGG